MHNPYLIGEQIYLRALEREDALTLQPWINDPETRRTLRPRNPITLRMEEQFIERITQSENELILMIVRRDVDKPVGACGLNHIDPRNRNAEFGILIARAEWGQGFGTEATVLMVQHAFDSLNLQRVYLFVYEYNPRAIHSYEKVGFRQEGVLRQDNFREGRYWDTLVMGILRDEWLAGRNATPEA